MTEKDFWEAIGRASSQEKKTVCLALSDWLEENGQPEKAEWIRQCLKDGAVPVHDPRGLWFDYPIGCSWWNAKFHYGKWHLIPPVQWPYRCHGYGWHAFSCICAEIEEEEKTSPPQQTPAISPPHPTGEQSDDIPF